MEELFAILEPKIIEHATKMGIINRHWEQKKLNSLVDAVISAVIRSKMTISEFEDCLEKASNGDVIDIDFFNNGGNVWKYVDSTAHPLAKALWSQRSTAIGTPNAASGEGELMFLFLSPEILMPSSGDLLVRGKEIELKGNQARVQVNVRGKDFCTDTVALAKRYGLTPNTPNGRKGEAAELEKESHKAHWTKQLASISDKLQREFLYEWLKLISPLATNGDAKLVLKGGFNLDTLQRTIVKLLFAEMVNSGNWSKIVFLGDGSSSIICDTNTAHFNELIDKNKITLGNDYFRTNRYEVLAWYIEPN